VTITDRAAGALQGAADAALGVKHYIRSDDLSPHPRDREEAARARWHDGQPARNAFERDVYAVLENDAEAGMNRLTRQGKQASALEAAMTKEAENREAGS
jgi:hypothetical protein